MFQARKTLDWGGKGGKGGAMRAKVHKKPLPTKEDEKLSLLI